jgi:hypothetical protein
MFHVYKHDVKLFFCASSKLQHCIKVEKQKTITTKVYYSHLTHSNNNVDFLLKNCNKANKCVCLTVSLALGEDY